MASLTPSQHTHTDDPAHETPTAVAQDLAQSRESGLAQAPECEHTQLTGRQRFVVAVTFFSMFFGAGNLIFPPLVGALSGHAAVPALVGFTISAVGLPILGVIVVARAGGFAHLSARVSRHFSLILGVAIMLTIGPLFAIPRTASTSFEMAVVPFLPSGARPWAQFAYSVVFFALAFVVAQHPDRLTAVLGRIMGPILLVMIAALFVACLVVPHGPFTAPTGVYKHDQLIQGFLDGYQTMDLIAALYFGIVISANIKELGVRDESRNRAETGIGGLWTGAMLIIVYGVLGFVGAVSETFHAIDPTTDTGATVLTNLTSHAFGPVGLAFIGIVFVIACFNVCTGLISTCSSYFHTTFPRMAGHRVSYRVWSLVFTLISLAIANIGLSAIIALSVPVLEFLYPIAIVLVALALFGRVFTQRFPRAYLWTVLGAGIASGANAIRGLAAVFGAHLEWLDRACALLPLQQVSLGWLAPAAVGLVIGIAISIAERRRAL
ncbi:branched-chain amino acid transport system II carrier protein [Bifidobacterium pseudolongum subsp. globosum]|uniref:Branched-chain amino acid transport system II carrier protein n=1 Tax=Bifidobacterium pseudolongum subsp. globosum TaxID=1690 RepID=A0A2N3QY21_9BIFI|nr:MULTISPECIES: branched-chain amino acid transport system II carrier protein [Bifidobacterium]KFI77484.1 branched-chain amino acid transport system II carrier protein [Bifidobacterium pseudolongum subsp. globosum]MEE1201761.1 branched-chain amino acid transport system II carrier protein [Bifidobacterium sp.]NLW57454.1 branched-chain amino acid transport system II carrier protein [Bifidobacterium pseudolongum subsp. globosum]PKU96693.1 branched-chain amino acid transport system II carrier prot